MFVKIKKLLKVFDKNPKKSMIKKLLKILDN